MYKNGKSGIVHHKTKSEGTTPIANAFVKNHFHGKKIEF